MEKGYFLKRKNGDVWQWDMWQPGMAIVDFTNPAACKWYADKLEKLLDMGVDCFKTDFGERIPTEAVYYDGSDPEKIFSVPWPSGASAFPPDPGILWSPR